MNDKTNPNATEQETAPPEGFSAQQESSSQEQASPMKDSSKTSFVTDGRKPIDSIIHQCRRSLYFVVIATVIIDMMYLVPMLFMMTVMDKVMTSRSVVTLVSITVVIMGFYVFWSALEWIRTRMMVRLSLRMDWDLSADIFDSKQVLKKEIKNSETAILLAQEFLNKE